MSETPGPLLFSVDGRQMQGSRGRLGRGGPGGQMSAKAQKYLPLLSVGRGFDQHPTLQARDLGQLRRQHNRMGKGVE